MSKSELEELLAAQMHIIGIQEPESEYRFRGVSGKRRWRFDFAWPDRMVAVEVEGGTYSGGRHVRGGGFEKDCEKMNEATLLGWRVLRATGNMVRDGRAAALIEEALSLMGTIT